MAFDFSSVATPFRTQPGLRRLARSAAGAGQVRDALANMSRAVLAYRGLDVARDRLLAWLDAQACSLGVA